MTVPADLKISLSNAQECDPITIYNSQSSWLQF
jgi:hypothetical protein